jgi:hypothetical protein
MSTNQEKILGMLFKSPKTTTELANELGYVDSKGTARYNMIKDDLDKLIAREYIESKKEKLKKTGRTPTQYSINYNIINLRKILDDYPNLIGDMQENDSVLETIIQAHSGSAYSTTDEIYIEQSTEQIIEQDIINATDEKLIEQSTEQIIELYPIPNFGLKKNSEDLKKKLKLSHEFFKLHLSNETDYLSESIEQLAQTLCDEWYSTYWTIKTSPTRTIHVRKTIYKDEMAFKACVSSDVLHQRSNAEAIEYVKQLVNEVPYHQIEKWKKYYENNIVAPRFLRGKKLLCVEDPKLQKIEQEFIDKGGKFIDYY